MTDRKLNGNLDLKDSDFLRLEDKISALKLENLRISNEKEDLKDRNRTLELEIDSRKLNGKNLDDEMEKLKDIMFEYKEDTIQFKSERDSA